ncbi:bifunctional 2-keto-4-hydroxyglutarate aldolase/2-keto-3-deoxy-6-phosphogluconate aldolase [Paenibacillus sp. JX-17]|uniref:Bifunctional 2-keto-4-hydroxyglutarate aldolase/2-keto-3-deoxy-6-phosphogluconate aldolase n=1 Tax=Paenibacillus lacisoli TaxID=3064525 RepID=A0ABT9CFZ7_9BACL|nr:bifunctional 2-keto-4-hydroxyglutarate aldolase/2-keto-3-deoxy-6-phosphogluconate aldolase [Paenibacillus sp. JX-17]MDO7908131.1 bifunctional 2-keto-4-hydroxyglutarate aldolase/2-keto-3-deoxy-6-phosphogluconate aldolase [Paenibacillus sp. JX-17]
MNKLKLLQKIEELGMVAVLRANTSDDVVEMAEQAIEGGIRVIEITMTVPGALQAIEKLRRVYHWDSSEPERFAIIGAGTVLEPVTARAAIMAGAEFVVSPSLNPETVRMCNLYRIPIMPGVVTPAEIQEALELGVDIMKLFPGSMFAPSMIKTLKGPLPQANFMPTGGVSLSNMKEWVAAGAVAVGVGSELTADAVRTGNMESIREQAQKYVEAYRKAKTSPA